MGPSCPTVFIVDDDEAVRQSLRALLESYEFKVEDYESGPAFLARYSADMRGCVLLDMHLPEMSGLEILTRFRTDMRGELPVLMITGRADRATRQRLLEAGANSLFEKPLDSDRLVETIQALTAA